MTRGHDCWLYAKDVQPCQQLPACLSEWPCHSLCIPSADRSESLPLPLPCQNSDSGHSKEYGAVMFLNVIYLSLSILLLWFYILHNSCSDYFKTSKFSQMGLILIWLTYLVSYFVTFWEILKCSFVCEQN